MTQNFQQVQKFMTVLEGNLGVQNAAKSLL